MAIKLFLDTNIILDVLDNERKFSKESISLFNLIEDRLVLAFISESVITTTDYILIKKFPLIQRTAIIKDLLDHVTIIECTNTIVQTAIIKNEKDIEDAILYELAISKKLDYFVSNDKVASKKLTTNKLPIVTSKEFLRLYSFKK